MTTEMDAQREVRIPPWYVRYAEFDGIAVVLSERDLTDTAHVDSTRFVVTWGSLPFVGCPVCAWEHKGCEGAYIWEGDDSEEAERQFHEAEIRLLRGEFDG